MTDENFAELEALSDYQLDYTMMSTGLPIAAENFRAMMTSWQAAENESGEYLSHGDYEVKVKSDGVVLSTLTKFEDREATISFSFDEDSNLESMDVSAKFSVGEILKKAGLNTVLGMGTVFVVLITLAFIIYLMKYIPNLIGGEGESEWLKQEDIAQVDVTPNVETTKYIDDLELVAVITAAIAAQEGKSADSFIVRSIRRRPSNHWS